MSEPTVLMSASDIDRALARIAHQVLETVESESGFALVGIHTRGVPLAHRVADRIENAGLERPPVGVLDMNLYRDDLSRPGGGQPRLHRTHIPVSIEDRQVILVDDVLYTGRTIRAAMDALIDLGRPQAIRLAVLIDRGGRELPIHADFLGRSFTVLPDRIIDVMLSEIDGGEDRIVLRSLEPGETPPSQLRARPEVKGARTGVGHQVRSVREGARTAPPEQGTESSESASSADEKAGDAGGGGKRGRRRGAHKRGRGSRRKGR
jgi:pyrimidine operon attenuation protein/uracil phosphoribosyltransferase